MKPKIPDWVKKKADLYEHLYREGLKRARRIQRNGYLSMSLSPAGACYLKITARVRKL